MPDLAIDLCGITLRHPTVLASGILGTGREILARVAAAGAGAVTGWVFLPFYLRLRIVRAIIGVGEAQTVLEGVR